MSPPSPSSATTATHDFLLHHLNVLVTGPSFPHHDDPLKCWVPLFRSYDRPQPPPPSPQSARARAEFHPHLHHQPSTPGPQGDRRGFTRPLISGAQARAVPSAEAKDGKALVYDKSISYTWKFHRPMSSYEVFFWEKALEAAVGQEVLGVAVDAWLSEEGLEVVEEMSPIAILQAFGDYIAALGTLPVTLPLREVVLEMIDSYTAVSSTIEPFAWAATGADLIPVLEAFVRSQEIFFFPLGREPVLEVTFSVKKWHSDALDLEFYVAWNPVRADFIALNNVVTEGKEFSIKPVFPEPNNLPPEETRSVIVPATASFSVSIADESWLQWIH